MYICLCRAVTDGQIKEAVADGACKIQDLQSRLGVGTDCGKCGKHAKEVLKQSLNTQAIDAHQES